MKPLQDITGQKFNRLLVKQMLGFNEKHHTLCLCLCDCGGQTIEKAAEVISGHVKSCVKCRTTNRKPDLTGRRFGRLVVLRYVGKDSRNNRAYECQCDCGRTKIVAATLLRGGYIKSCRCLYQQSIRKNLSSAHRKQVKHGEAKHPLYPTWNKMMDRCYNRNSSSFAEWGGRGILVCQFLRALPSNIHVIIGDKPTPEHSLDRIANEEGSYTCGQCPECVKNGWSKNIRWGTKKEQAGNRRSSIILEIGGVRKTRSEWAAEMGLTIQQAIYRLRKFEVKSQRRIEFHPPAGAVPEGTQANEEFDLVCTFRVKSDGQVCLVVMGDKQLPGYAERDKGKPGYGDEHAAMMKGTGGGEVQTGY